MNLTYMEVQYSTKSIFRIDAKEKVTKKAKVVSHVEHSGSVLLQNQDFAAKVQVLQVWGKI